MRLPPSVRVGLRAAALTFAYGTVAGTEAALGILGAVLGFHGARTKRATEAAMRAEEREDAAAHVASCASCAACKSKSKSKSKSN